MKKLGLFALVLSLSSIAFLSTGCEQKDLAKSAAGLDCSVDLTLHGDEKGACDRGVAIAREAVEPLSWYSSIARAEAALFSAKSKCSSEYQSVPALQSACITGVNYYQNRVIVDQRSE